MQWFTMNWMSISFLNTDPSATVPINPILSCHFCPAALTSDSSCITSGWFPDNASATWSYKRCAPEQADLARLSNPDKRVGLILVTSSFSRKKPHLQPVMSLYWLIHTFQCFTFTQTPKCAVSTAVFQTSKTYLQRPQHRYTHTVPRSHPCRCSTAKTQLPNHYCNSFSDSPKRRAAHYEILNCVCVEADKANFRHSKPESNPSPSRSDDLQVLIKGQNFNFV